MLTWAFVVPKESGGGHSEQQVAAAILVALTAAAVIAVGEAFRSRLTLPLALAQSSARDDTDI